MEHVRIFEFLSLLRDQPFSYLMKLPFTLVVVLTEIHLSPVRIRPRSGLLQVVLSPVKPLELFGRSRPGGDAKS